MKLHIPVTQIKAFCQRWQVVEFSLFGSAIRGDFNHDSDVDVMVSFAKTAAISLFDLVQMEIELEELFEHPVDTVEKEALRNPFRRSEILGSARVVYAA